jgi:hypothetical protein
MVKFRQAGCVNRDQQTIEVSIILISGNAFIFTYRIFRFAYVLSTSYLYFIAVYLLEFILFRK